LPRLVELAEVRNDLLSDLAALANRAHQLPVDVELAVFAPPRCS